MDLFSSALSLRINVFPFLGPRFVLNPIRIFEGSFGGSTLYQNPHYVSPNDVSHVLIIPDVLKQ
jgi:hypothetical protein